MTLKEWRESKKWSQGQLANVLSWRLGRAIKPQHVSSWERGVMPGADVGELIRKMSSGKVTGGSYGKKQGGESL